MSPSNVYLSPCAIPSAPSPPPLAVKTWQVKDKTSIIPPPSLLPLNKRGNIEDALKPWQVKEEEAVVAVTDLGWTASSKRQWTKLEKREKAIANRKGLGWAHLAKMQFVNVGKKTEQTDV